MNLLSKSKFKLAINCPTKLFYKKENYVDTKTMDSFLENLADGGFQVGSMAKDLYPNGHNIETLDSLEAVEETNKLLEQEDVIIYEAAILWEGCIIRVDILEKFGNNINLVEVKSKSYSSLTGLRTKNNEIRGEFKEYLYDIAFQYHVAKNAFPNMSINPYLFLVNKDEVCQDNILNQRYVLYKENNRTFVKVNEEIPAPKDELLVEVECLDEVLEIINYIQFMYNNKLYTFTDYIELAKEILNSNIKPISRCDKNCKGCEFQDGFNECWGDKIDLNIPMVWDINNLHYTKKNKMFAKEQYLITDLDDEDIKEYKLNERQQTQLILQKENMLSGNVEMFVETEKLKAEMETFNYPLHFIDFETIAPAIPMNKGLTPYEAMLFQFSHHILHEDGTVEHKTEYINTVKGFFPSIKVVRELKKALENDNGTIFRYHNHENTILNSIRKQMLSMIDNGENDEDFPELITFIESITQRDEIFLVNGKNKKKKVKGDRNMVDLCEMVKKYYYSTIMGGSNSIKYVLPSVLNTSNYLQEKYSTPVYSGKNFKDKIWIEHNEKGEVQNPYNLLGENVVCNGGDAMVNYSVIQYVDTDKETVQKLKAELLAYCELDTFSMVVIYEHFLELCGKFENLTKI